MFLFHALKKYLFLVPFVYAKLVLLQIWKSSVSDKTCALMAIVNVNLCFVDNISSRDFASVLSILVF